MQFLDLLACLSLAFQSSYALSQNTDLYETLSPPAAVKNNIVTESNITSDPIEVEQRAEPGVTPLMQEQILSPRQPYVNNFQRQQVLGKNEMKCIIKLILTRYLMCAAIPSPESPSAVLLPAWPRRPGHPQLRQGL